MKTIMLIVAILIFGASVYWFFTQSQPTKTTPIVPITQSEITTNTNQTEDRTTEELQPRISAPIESTPTNNSPLVCTMDVQQCPDGSYVGRVPPSCSFAQCPVRATPPPTNK